MKKAFIAFSIAYLIFAITADFQVLKRNYSLGEEGTYLLSQLSWGELTPEALNNFRKFYPAGGKIAVTLRGKPILYSPWVYDYMVRPFFLIFGERGFYFFNLLFIVLSFFIIYSLFSNSTWFFLPFLASSFPLFLLLEGPYALILFLSSLLLWGILKKEPYITGISLGFISFFSPLFFFFIPLIVLLGSKRPLLSSILGFSGFFILVFSGLLLGRALPWDVPVLLDSYFSVSSFLSNPIIFYGGSFPLWQFLVGRFTGMLLYFPVFLLLLPKKNEWGFFITALALLSIFLLVNPVHAPFGFVGNPWIFPGVVLALPFMKRRLSKTWTLISMLALSIVLLLPFRSLSNPLLHSKVFPFGIFPPEVNILEALPSVRIGDNYHLDLNFYNYKGKSLVPRGKAKVEFIRVSSEPVLRLVVHNLADENQVFIKVNSSKRKVKLEKGESFNFVFNGKRAGNVYFYRVIFKSQRCKVYLPSKLCLGARLEW
ncbi:MAG: hypothetical protein J7L62_02640 [Candidatus Aminicenantes bacterium]|nr:hypothetical protein [Candidatus Aminicenantes bacterium]